MDQEFAARPGVGIIAPTLNFDAVVLPRPLAMFALTLAERGEARVPSVVARHQAALLVAPRTAAAALGALSWTVVAPTAGWPCRRPT
ncbi:MULTISPECIES: hypothetical protein [Streptomyces]|uniref:Uncharacterized protein n=1 Tax=Streptomyces mordarskii TaxID=1226758 RepID=A0ABN1DQU0_9ACTN